MKSTFFIIGLTAIVTALNCDNVYAADCFKSSIVKPQPFMGNNDEIFQLLDGSVWQVKYEYEYLYAYFPDVIVCPSEGRLIIETRKLNVVELSPARMPPKVTAPADHNAPPPAPNQQVIQSRINGDFKGWEGETVYQLTNGQIWQQSSYHYHYHYAYSPEVLIYPSAGGFKIHVEDDDDEDVSVIRLK